MSNDSEKEAKRIYAIAYQIAEKAHAGQFRNLPDGRPYIEHCKDVAALMPTWELRTVAILHDIIEDTETTADDLLKAGIPAAIVEAVVAMTKPEDGEYGDYIRSQVRGNDLAKKVKLADNYFNLKDRVAGMIADWPNAKDHRDAIAKYAKGMGILME